MKGKLFIFDGIDASGKTTIAKKLAQELQGIYLREPGKTGIRGLIRKIILQPIDPLTELFLFLADRRENYLQLKNYLKQGKIIFLDRSFPATLAYQLKAKNIEKFISLKEYLHLDHLARLFIEPDQVIIFDLPVKAALQRLKRKKTKFEEVQFLQKVRKSFLDLARKFNWQVINANQPKEKVFQEAKAFLSAFM